MYDYVDIHSHLNLSEYDADRKEVIAKLKEENIATITVGTGYITSNEAVVLSEEYENLYACVGLHPIDRQEETFDEAEFTKLIAHKKVVAVGECGLDYSCLSEVVDIEAEKKRQKKEFETQIEFAVRHDKPLIIHCREAYPDALTLLESKKKEYGEKLRGDFHFFTSPIEIAQQCLDMGFTVSFTGPITFARQYEEVVAYVPLEKMMAETDAPYASPKPYRGKRNNPLYVKEIVGKIAEIKKLDIDIVRKKLAENAFYLFLRSISS